MCVCVYVYIYIYIDIDIYMCVYISTENRLGVTVSVRHSVTAWLKRQTVSRY